MKWTEGRQGSGYYWIRLLNSQWLKADCYLIKYPPGSRIPRHTDPVEAGFRHFRLNIVLKQAKSGGHFYAWHKEIWHWPFDRIIFFRPDITPHIVNKVKSGTRWVLSIGWLSREVGMNREEWSEK